MDFTQNMLAHKIQYIDKYIVDIRAYVILYEIHRDLSSKIVDTEATQHGKSVPMQLSAELDNIFQWFRCTNIYIYHNIVCQLLSNIMVAAFETLW